MTSTYIATHKNITFILEYARKGSTKLIASAMPAYEPAPDRRIMLRKVPLFIRRAARATLA
jgi:hypothetical protein